MISSSKRLSARLLCGAGAAAMLAFAGQARAEVRQFDIPSSSLGEALARFGAQSDLAVVTTTEITRAKNSQAVSGSVEPEVALAQLLEGTDLTYRREGDTFLIVRASDPQSGSAAGDGADGTVDALIVTAQKREEDIQDVPIAISAFSQEALERSQIAGGPDLITQVPNMTFTKTNFSSYSVQIRGIGTQAISATTDPAVAIAFNNTPFVRNRFFEQEFYDLQRVEVLRGPQGTLYGRNATAGVVNIISQKPKFGYEAKLSADMANYNSTRLEGMVNIPLADNVVALRLAGAWTKREGYSTNEITGNPIDGRDLWSTRLSLRVAPTDRLEANLIWEHFEEDDDRLRSGKQMCHRDARTEIGGLTFETGGFGANGNQVNQGCLPASLYSPDSFEAPNGFSLPYYVPLGAIFLPIVPYFDPYVSTTQSRDLRVIESTVDPSYRARTDIVELQFSYDLTDELTLTSETAWGSDFIFSTQDFNRFNTARGAFRNPGPLDDFRDDMLLEGEFGGIFCDPQIGCADRLVGMDLSTAKSTQFSQEFRLGSNYDGPFNFSLGANFLRGDSIDKYYVFFNTLTMYAAISPYGHGMDLSPYVNGVTDNSECLRAGFQEPDPTRLQTVAGCQYIDPNPIGALNDQGHNYFLSKNPYKLISYAMFGEAYYNVTDVLKVTAGLRWTVDKKEAPRIPSWILSGDNVGYPVAEVIEQEWREPTGRLTVDWKPDVAFTDETLLYASFAHGYKAGGANPPAAGVVSYANADTGEELIAQSALHPRTFDAEFIDAFEIGAKNTLLSGRLTLNVNAFYYDYTDYQISYIVNRSAVNLNFDAQIWGAELEADWRPLENLKFGLKLGYEDTRVADGERAIDVMDRTAGNPDWIVVRPFPTFPSNCIVPLYTVVGQSGRVEFGPNSNVNGNVGHCEQAYILGNDPVTWFPYVPNPTVSADQHAVQSYHPGYIGWDPTLDYGNNHGEGFYKDLSGNQLPNAPHYTATLTADYTLPLPNNWLATLHTDLYYQSEAWTRIFNVDGYDKLKAYSNINLAAIFTDEEAGWRVMAYVKNVLDRDSITGAFLNSDDTGLTTNVFLTEPRLYGLRVTREWSGGPWWTGGDPSSTGPFPLTVELGGQIQRRDAPYSPVEPAFLDSMSPTLSPASVQGRGLDWGDGRSIRVLYRTGNSWEIGASWRRGEANGGNVAFHGEEKGPAGCLLGPPRPPSFCQIPALQIGGYNHTDATVTNRDEYEFVEFSVGKEVGLGRSDGALKSKISAGLRYANFESRTGLDIWTVGNWQVPQYWAKYENSQHDIFRGDLTNTREFEGAGPTLTWDAAFALFNGEGGRLSAEFSVAGGALFGKQTNVNAGDIAATYYDTPWLNPVPPETGTIAPPEKRSSSVTAPLLDLSFGLS